MYVSVHRRITPLSLFLSLFLSRHLDFLSSVLSSVPVLSLSLSLFLRLFICAFSPSFRLRPTCFPRSSFTSFFLGIQRISPYNSSAGRK